MRHRPFMAGHVVAGLFTLCAVLPAWAADYYVSNGSWGDGNSGTSTLFPWRTLNKVNTAALNPGDRVLFRKGDVWEGTLKLKHGVTYGSYPDNSSEAAPLIRASSYVGGLSWSRHSGNIYVADVSSIVVSETDVEGKTYPASIGQLVYNGVRLQRARHPNIDASAGGNGVFNRGQNRYLRIAPGTPIVDEATTHTMLLETGAVPAAVLAGDLLGAQVYARNYSWFLTRYAITSAPSKTQVTVTADPLWPGDKSYRLQPGNGYWLENKLWMLDKAGEWVFDAASKKLYVWLPGGVSPAGKALYAASRVHAIEGRNVAQVAVKGIAVAESRGDAVAINRATTSVTLDGLNVARAGTAGISVINNGNGSGTVSNSVVSDSGGVGIYLGADSTRSIHVRGNTVRNAGMGLYAHAAIWLGHGSQASGNLVERASYIGIRAAKSNTISDNQVLGACLEFDDCGGIYARGLDYDGSLHGLPYKNDVGNTIHGNFVIGTPVESAPDRLDGMAGALAVPPSSATNGIYLDDFAGSVTVSNNYVTGFDQGVMLHYGRGNTVSNNTLVGNVRSQLWMQENRHGSLTSFATPQYCGTMPDCDANNYLRFNTVSGNVMASRLDNPVIVHASDFAGTEDFATYARNVYATYGTTALAAIDMSGTRSLQTFGKWVQGGQDTQVLSPWNVFATGPAVKAAPGAGSLAINGGFDQGFSSWASWHGVPVVGADGCFGGGACLSVEPSQEAEWTGGRRLYIVNTDSPMALTAGQRYLLTFDAQAQNTGDSVYLELRSMSTYASKSNGAGFALATGWQTYSALLTATESLSNARLDFELRSLGKVRLDNVRIVPVQTVSGRAEPVGFYNAGTSAKSVACPVSDATACTRYVDIKTGQTISFPFSLAAKSARVAVLNDPVWRDTDRDGVPGDGAPGGVDRCPDTADGAGVNEAGCAVGQVPRP